MTDLPIDRTAFHRLIENLIGHLRADYTGAEAVEVRALCAEILGQLDRDLQPLRRMNLEMGDAPSPRIVTIATMAMTEVRMLIAICCFAYDRGNKPTAIDLGIKALTVWNAQIRPKED